MATITKGNIVNQMFVMLRISGMTSGATPEDTVDALNILERMVLSLENIGLRLGFQKSSVTAGPQPADESGIRDKDVHAIVLLLAKSVAPAFNKALHPDLRAELVTAWSGLFDTVAPIRVQNPYQPAGQGNNYYCQDNWYNRFMNSEDRLTVENNGQLAGLEVNIDRRGFHGN